MIGRLLRALRDRLSPRDTSFDRDHEYREIETVRRLSDDIVQRVDDRNERHRKTLAAIVDSRRDPEAARDIAWMDAQIRAWREQ